MDDIKQIINDTVNATVLKLKMAGLMKGDKKSAYQKTEELLKNYNAFKESDQNRACDIVILSKEAVVVEAQANRLAWPIPKQKEYIEDICCSPFFWTYYLLKLCYQGKLMDK